MIQSDPRMSERKEADCEPSTMHKQLSVWVCDTHRRLTDYLTDSRLNEDRLTEERLRASTYAGGVRKPKGNNSLKIASAALGYDSDDSDEE